MTLIEVGGSGLHTAALHWKAVIRGSRVAGRASYAWEKVRAYALREGVNWRQAMGLAFNRHPADGS